MLGLPLPVPGPVEHTKVDDLDLSSMVLYEVLGNLSVPLITVGPYHAVDALNHSMDVEIIMKCLVMTA